jgi:hypothetical protein
MHIDPTWLHGPCQARKLPSCACVHAQFGEPAYMRTIRENPQMCVFACACMQARSTRRGSAGRGRCCAHSCPTRATSSPSSSTTRCLTGARQGLTSSQAAADRGEGLAGAGPCMLRCCAIRATGGKGRSRTLLVHDCALCHRPRLTTQRQAGWTSSCCSGRYAQLMTGGLRLCYTCTAYVQYLQVGSRGAFYMELGCYIWEGTQVDGLGQVRQDCLQIVVA